MDVHAFRHALASYIGRTLTPALCAEIETCVRMAQAHPIPLDQFKPCFFGEFVISVERFADVLDELKPIHARHWEETERHRHGLALDPAYDWMLAKDRAGEMLQFTVRRAGTLVGQLRMFVERAAHSDNKIATEDTLFIVPECRGGTLALRLLRYAEDSLVAIGVREILASSKALNRADVLMRRRGFTLIGYDFHKMVGEATHGS